MRLPAVANCICRRRSDWMSAIASGMPISKGRDTGKRQRLQHHVPDHFGKLGARVWPSDAADPVFASIHAFPKRAPPASAARPPPPEGNRPAHRRNVLF